MGISWQRMLMLVFRVNGNYIHHITHYGIERLYGISVPNAVRSCLSSLICRAKPQIGRNTRDHQLHREVTAIQLAGYAKLTTCCTWVQPRATEAGTVKHTENGAGCNAGEDKGKEECWRSN